MKTLKLSATLMLLGTLTLGTASQTDADNTTQEQTQTKEQTKKQSQIEISISVDAQIAAINAAKTPEQRVALVNEFKTTITSLSNTEKQAAISQYRSSMHSSNTYTQNQTKQRSREGQMRETRDTQKMQMMNQYQTANQAMHSGAISGNMNNMSSSLNMNSGVQNTSSTTSGSTQTNFMSR